MLLGPGWKWFLSCKKACSAKVSTRYHSNIEGKLCISVRIKIGTDGETNNGTHRLRVNTGTSLVFCTFDLPG